MTQLEKIGQLIEKNQKEAVELAYNIWNYAELSYMEEKSAGDMIAALEKKAL